jgi:hypothetical protein
VTDIPLNDYLPSCEPQGGTCGTSASLDVLLRRDCPVHGDLAVLLSKADTSVTEKTAASAKAHQGAAIAWQEITTGAAEFFEGLAAKIRGDR